MRRYQDTGATNYEYYGSADHHSCMMYDRAIRSPVMTVVNSTEAPGGTVTSQISNTPNMMTSQDPYVTTALTPRLAVESLGLQTDNRKSNANYGSNNFHHLHRCRHIRGASQPRADFDVDKKYVTSRCHQQQPVSTSLTGSEPTTRVVFCGKVEPVSPMRSLPDSLQQNQL